MMAVPFQQNAALPGRSCRVQPLDRFVSLVENTELIVDL
jgi:hypothetical protein